MLKGLMYCVSRKSVAGGMDVCRQWNGCLSPGEWMSVAGECCVLAGEGLLDGLIPRPEESYRLSCVSVCDLETLKIKLPGPD